MNTSTSPSNCIARKTIGGLIDGANFAIKVGCPLTRSLVFIFERCAVRGQQFVISFTKLAGDWLRVHGITLAYIWVLEHPTGKSLNLHLLMHVPDSLQREFQKREKQWAVRAGLKWSRKARRSQKIGIRPGEKDRVIEGGEYLVHLEQALRYNLKGGEPEACRILRIDHVCQGVVKGKRAGCSESIGRTARMRNGYRAPVSNRTAGVLVWRYQL